MAQAGAIFLSHLLTPDTPGYGGSSGFCADVKTRISEGKSSNSAEWKLSNHIGTHVDVPYHFSDAGLRIDDYPAETWIFSKPCLVDYAAKPAELIGPGDWVNYIPQDADLILLRTGFEKHRSEKIYWEMNPGLSPELGSWLREQRPAIRAIGVDVLSATSWQHREIGRKAHRHFLDPAFQGEPVRIIEDMALAALESTPSRVIVAPIRVKGGDGAPVTVIAET